MDGWGKPNPSDRRHPTSPTETLHPVTAQQRPSRYQEQSETQIPFVSTPSPHHTIPPPVLLNTPALWQLGRHSQYTPSTAYYQRSPNPSVQPDHGSPELDGDGISDPVRVQHQVNEYEEGKVHDVEKELHRRLKARQVRLLSVLVAI